MFPKAQQGDRFSQIWSREFYNFLLSQIRQDLNLTNKKHPFIPDPIRGLAEAGEFLEFTPVRINSGEQIRGGYKTPIVKVGALSTNDPWGVIQSKCTTSRAAELVVNGISWCNVTINDVAHQYAAVDGSTLESVVDSVNAVARIITAVTDGPSLIQFPFPGTTQPCEGIQPGSYPATVDETIDPETSGLITITLCDEETVTVVATNHSNHTFYENNLVTAHVDTCCNIHFTGVPCFDSAPEVTPTTSMFVLGFDPGSENSCKIVKFPITECP
jgi:hypothetical protein